MFRAPGFFRQLLCNEVKSLVKAFSTMGELKKAFVSSLKVVGGGGGGGERVAAAAAAVVGMRMPREEERCCARLLNLDSWSLARASEASSS